MKNTYILFMIILSRLRVLLKKGDMMRTILKLTIHIVFIALALCITSAGALSITQYPDELYVGQAISVGIEGMGDGQAFALHVGEVSLSVNPGETFEFTASDFAMPFTLNDMTVQITAENVDWAELRVKKPSGDIFWMRNETPVNHVASITHNAGTQNGTFEFITISGEPYTYNLPVILDIWVNGTTDDVGDPIALGFAVTGFEKGDVPIAVSVDGVIYLEKTIHVLPPLPPNPGGGGAADSGEPTVSEPEATSAEPTQSAITQEETPGATPLATEVSSTDAPLTEAPDDSQPADTEFPTIALVALIAVVGIFGIVWIRKR
jgi:hypothetical protein